MRENGLQIFSEATAAWFEEAVGTPTRVQEEAWPSITSGCHTLVSAPTGTGKTLSAFLVFIDRMKREAEEGILSEELKLIYVSPLKSLAGDIRENLRRPLDGISLPAETQITVGIRTGDTSQSERRRMIKHPPHILITTPESLFLLLSSRSGLGILSTARAVIIDELHALIDTKRGAHLMLSLARLDRLNGRSLQRIGLSATIEPLPVAAAYLATGSVNIVAPRMEKQVEIKITGPMPMIGQRRKDPVWEEVGQSVYRQCLGHKSVIAFTEGRRFAEKLAYYVNQYGGEDFARVHHGSLSKEQRYETEMALREGRLRLLCATSSMELGIDVGDIELVLQIGCPRTISGTMQRLGRAGHNPGRVSVMYMYPRTAPECVMCGLTAQVAKEGGVEHTKPPRLCLDVLAQHLVSMAVEGGYRVDQVLELTETTYSFRDVTKEDVESVLRMLAGDYEHSQEIPVRPRILYDRLHGLVEGDAYSRMLSVHAGGTIPDKGLYSVRNEEGVKLGELDEEFVYESKLGDTFLLGAFAWRIVGQDKDNVIVSQAPVDGARMPFWKGETRGRALKTGLAFGKILRSFNGIEEEGPLLEKLREMGLDEAAAASGADFLWRQKKATGALPDDRTIVVEHFRNQNGDRQVMVHSLFGRRVNAPLSILAQQAARSVCQANVGCVDEEEGFLLYPYDGAEIPKGILLSIDRERAVAVLEALLPVTPIFSMNFRYNSARALMMGMRLGGRQPLWMQRLRSTQMMETLLSNPDHPLIRETRRECLEENWDMEGMLDILDQIHSGQIAVREVYTETPSPLSLPFQWQQEAAEMYEYVPVTEGIRQTVRQELQAADQLKPDKSELERQMGDQKQPEDEGQFHTRLMVEGDMAAGELFVPAGWLGNLSERGLITYVEPGLWIAAEHREEYEKAFLPDGLSELAHIVRRMLRYRGGKSAPEIGERYCLDDEVLESLLVRMCEDGSLVEDDGIFYHARLYDRARKATVKQMRAQAVTQPGARYAALLAERMVPNQSAEEQIREILGRFCGKSMPAPYWEGVILNARVKRYGEAMLDRLLAQGEFFWQLRLDGTLAFYRYEDIDWDQEPTSKDWDLDREEACIYGELKRRGASFLQSLEGLLPTGDVRSVLLRLAEKGLVCADSFLPVRQWLGREALKKATVRQRVNVRVKALSAGRWDVVRPIKKREPEAFLNQIMREKLVICREVFVQTAPSYGSHLAEEMTWQKALGLLSIWEYTGQVRRGYFVKGLSGAQFVRKDDYPALVARDAGEPGELSWISAVDPDQIWGKILPHQEDRSFLNVPGTAVALARGVVIAVMERQGKVLRSFGGAGPEALMENFAEAFRSGKIYPDRKRLTVKQYPEGFDEAFRKSGFIKEMMDYVMYR